MRFGPCDGFLLREEGSGFKGGGEVGFSFSGLCEIVVCVNFGVTLSRGFFNSTKNNDCLGLCFGYLSPDEIDSARYKSRLDFNDENHE